MTKATNGENIFEVINTYDKDGNILSLERHGSTGIRIEAFNYIYYSGTNKLQRVSAAGTQYTYDANGNMISDALNKNVNIEYDHRNLIMELEHTKYILNDSLILLTKYYYDEAGNRIRKMTYDTEDDSLKSDIIYSRDVSGRELAVYENGNIKQWNLFGLDNIGYMTGSDELRFYLKDHLGSVRVVTDNQSAVINCQDYDQWGYILENRVYQSDESVYKFTSKERDEESQYDYFGARYYDARVGRWGSIDLLLEKHYDFSSYNYVLDNPMILIDPMGKQVFVAFGGYGTSDAGKTLIPEDYTKENPTGTEVLLNLISMYTEKNNLKNTKIAGYFASPIGVEIDKAFEFIQSNITNVSEPIILYGYSLGGYNINKLTDMLISNNIENDIILITVDAYSPAFQFEDNPGLEISEAVTINYNYYQEIPSNIYSRGYPSKPKNGKDNVKNILERNTTHRSIDEKTNLQASGIIISYLTRWRDK